MTRGQGSPDRERTSGVRRRAALHGVLLAAVLLIAGAVAARIVPLPVRLRGADSSVVRYRDGQVMSAFLAEDGRWRMAISPGDVDPRFVHALIRLEDRRFRTHLGVDPLAVLRAAISNARSGTIVSGGSTLSMQVARLAEPRPRTLPNKAREALRALQLELTMGKGEILAQWLRLAPYGGNVEGVGAASLIYFGHDARTLSRAEIATLLAVPQDPRRRAPTERNERTLRTARDRLAARLLIAGAFPRGEIRAASDEDVLAEIAAEPLPRTRPMPREAAHAARMLKSDGDIATTLSRSVQLLVDDRLARERHDLLRRGIRHAAVVVLDHTTGEVLALSAGAGGADDGDQIGSFAVPRSPGSALKPFVYALGIDRGLILPGFLVPDVPRAYGAWSPSNHDGRYDGLVTMEAALSRSLNLPFIELLGQEGNDTFVAKLREGGARSLSHEPGHYGLSAAVGGLEVTPLEVAGLFAALANDGLYREPTMRPPATAASRRLLSEGASFLTTRALSLRDRPDFPTRRTLRPTPPQIHWKTGTSTGRLDAWAVGSGALHTVAVWLGNLDREPSAYLGGADAAGPILFDLLEALHPRGEAVRLPSPPGELAAVDVCAYSGRVPAEACPRRVQALALRERVPPERCPFHVRREIDVGSGLAVRPGCRGGDTEVRTFLRWPASVAAFVAATHRHEPLLPAWAEGCGPAAPSRAPRLLSPPRGLAAVLLPGIAPEQQQVPLAAEADGDAELSWFVDGVWLGNASARERVWWTPREGAHEIVVADAAGRTDRRAVEVRAAR